MLSALKRPRIQIFDADFQQVSPIGASDIIVNEQKGKIKFDILRNRSIRKSVTLATEVIEKLEEKKFNDIQV